MNKFRPLQPDPFIKRPGDQELAKFGHLNAIVDFLNNIAPGGVVSITGLNVDNTNPAAPVINISVDGTTITGAGTPGDPLTASVTSQPAIVVTAGSFTGNNAPAIAALSGLTPDTDFLVFGGGLLLDLTTDYTFAGTTITIPTGATKLRVVIL